MERMVFEDVRAFSPRHIFECGQAFRWNADGDGYTGVAGGVAAKVGFVPDAGGREGGSVVVSGDNLEGAEDGEGRRGRGFWEHYLDLGRDYTAVNEALSEGDEAMARAVAFGEGIRILNQDPWESLISFIVSQNSHIPRIKGCIESLCLRFGGAVGAFGGREYRAFPGVEALAGLSEGDLAPCRLGYRAGYIVGAAGQVAARGGMRFLASLRGADLDEAERALLSLCGVGPKVAACVLLFGLGRTECFPVDVWVGRAMGALYGIDGNDRKAVLKYARARFGAHAGIAQQYIFHYMRNAAGARA
ncbi:MAG: hypothetical protein LBS32_03095 [Clostridiales Family XIII bacterium]|jgi:N-glycosylase/DNA lyase|nr:hypothetical protein [Clostridiales Family XIII bacterium]